MWNFYEKFGKYLTPNVSTALLAFAGGIAFTGASAGTVLGLCLASLVTNGFNAYFENKKDEKELRNLIEFINGSLLDNMKNILNKNNWVDKIEKWTSAKKISNWTNGIPSLAGSIISLINLRTNNSGKQDELASSEAANKIMAGIGGFAAATTIFSNIIQERLEDLKDDYIKYANGLMSKEKNEADNTRLSNSDGKDGGSVLGTNVQSVMLSSAAAGAAGTSNMSLSRGGSLPTLKPKPNTPPSSPSPSARVNSAV